MEVTVKQMTEARRVAAKTLGPGFIVSMRMSKSDPPELVAEQGNLQSTFVVTREAKGNLLSMVRQWANACRESVRG